VTILVCPLSKVESMIALHRPGRVVSLLDPESTFPELGPAYADRHLRLSFHDVHDPGPGHVVPAPEHLRALLAFVVAWDPLAPLLIHCRAGIGRSTAAAYVVACLVRPESDELELAVALRRAGPLARPNQTVVDLADREMGRNGRMSAAIAATGRGLAWHGADEGEPFQLSLSGAGARRAP
jgi:predicted protein tyrosine phosphatase